jgi:hypothetical protein
MDFKNWIILQKKLSFYKLDKINYLIYKKNKVNFKINGDWLLKMLRIK